MNYANVWHGVVTYCSVMSQSPRNNTWPSVSGAVFSEERSFCWQTLTFLTFKIFYMHKNKYKTVKERKKKDSGCLHQSKLIWCHIFPNRNRKWATKHKKSNNKKFREGRCSSQVVLRTREWPMWMCNPHTSLKIPRGSQGSTNQRTWQRTAIWPQTPPLTVEHLSSLPAAKWQIREEAREELSTPAAPFVFSHLIPSSTVPQLHPAHLPIAPPLYFSDPIMLK